MMARILPKHPHLRSPLGSFSDNKQIISPISGVKMTDKKKVQPKPILLLAPISPTNAARNEPVNNPKIKSAKVMLHGY